MYMHISNSPHISFISTYLLSAFILDNLDNNSTTKWPQSSQNVSPWAGNKDRHTVDLVGLWIMQVKTFSDEANSSFYISFLLYPFKSIVLGLLSSPSMYFTFLTEGGDSTLSLTNLDDISSFSQMLMNLSSDQAIEGLGLCLSPFGLL